MLRILLRHGANVNGFTTSRLQGKRGALHVAVLAGHDDVVAELLQHGAYIFDPAEQFVSSKNTSPLHLVMRKDCSRTLQLFLAHLKNEEKRNKAQNLIAWDTLISSAFDYKAENCLLALLSQAFHPVQQSRYSSFFYRAASQGLVNVMNVVMESNPYVLQDDWLVQSHIPNALRKHGEYVNFLLNCRRNPSTLLQLCRYTILAKLDSHVETTVDELPLPDTLKNCLRWTH